MSHIAQKPNLRQEVEALAASPPTSKIILTDDEDDSDVIPPENRSKYYNSLAKRLYQDMYKHFECVDDISRPRKGKFEWRESSSKTCREKYNDCLYLSKTRSCFKDVYKNLKSRKGPLTPAGLLKLVIRFEETRKLESRARAGRPCLKEAREPCIAVEMEAIASEAASGTSSAQSCQTIGLKTIICPQYSSSNPLAVPPQIAIVP
ncbi:hypothetical protein TNCV_2551541 [Trichonephila clavipes]|nr:hypothetical protein TNCV_2551541 [Trichonephila clavipes]